MIISDRFLSDSLLKFGAAIYKGTWRRTKIVQRRIKTHKRNQISGLWNDYLRSFVLITSDKQTVYVFRLPVINVIQISLYQNDVKKSHIFLSMIMT